MKLFNVMTTIMVLILGACGDLKNASLWSLDEEKQQNEDSIDSPVIYELEAPEQVGGSWKRILRLSLEADLSYWSVEKRSSPEQFWQPVGFTNAQGIFVDDDIDAPAQYRVASRFESPVFSAIEDEVLEGNLCSGVKDEIRLKAHRFVVPSGLEAFADGCSLMVEASEVIIDGELRSFASSSRRGRDARGLQISALRLVGRGKIIWTGEDGAHGATGVNGRNGKDADPSSATLNGEDGEDGTNGADGQNGGNGALVFLRIQEFTVGTDVGPGKGGLGGAGGVGGKGGAGRCGFHSDLDRRACGSRGRDGKNGLPGRAGNDGKFGTLSQF